jgi:hypothetical protein
MLSLWVRVNDGYFAINKILNGGPRQANDRDNTRAACCCKQLWRGSEYFSSLFIINFVTSILHCIAKNGEPSPA